METKELKLNQKERTVIAEFIYSYQAGILIKSDALYALDLLYKHKLIGQKEHFVFCKKVASNSENISTEIQYLIGKNLNYELINQIMNEYYGK